MVLDLQGSKWRVGRFPATVLETGRSVRLVLVAGGPGDIPVPHPDFFLAAPTSDGRALLADGRIEIALERVEPDRATAVVVRGGTLEARKGITLPGCAYRAERLTEADRQVVGATSDLSGVRYAVSYVRDAREMERYRAHLPSDRAVVAKLERRTAMADAAEVARFCDELWVCRGDLGAEMGLRDMAAAVAALGASLPTLGKPTLMAGQVLEHMTEHPLPTRAEVCHLHDLLVAGYAGVVLSDETAVGSYAIEAVRTAALFRSADT